MVDELFRYVEDQLKRGYTEEQIKEALLRNGYSPAIVEGVIQSVTIKPGPYYSSPSDSQGTKSFLPILLVGVLVVAGIIALALFAPDLFKGKQALLDVITYPDREHYRAGENVGFDVQIINMGSKERFDVVVSYKLFDSNDNLISNKEETLAVSTSISQHREMKLLPSYRPGQYTMKIIVNYDDKVASSSFSITVDEPKPAQATGTCFDSTKNQDETNIDCGGTCGGYWYDGTCHEEPKGTGSQETKPNSTTPGTKASCNDGIKNQDEAGIDCGGVCGGYWYNLKCNTNPKPSEQPVQPKTQSTGSKLLEIRMLAKTNPDAAKQGCLEFDDDKVRDSCLRSVAQVSKNSAYCDLVFSDSERDLCYYPFFMSGDYSVCDKLVIKESLQTCAQLKQISELQSAQQQASVPPAPEPEPEPTPTP